MALLRLARVGVFGCALGLSASAAEPQALPESSADHLTTSLAAMGEARVGDPVLSAWLEQQGEIPRLTGEQLARLKAAGLSDGILLQVVRSGGAVANPLPAAPAEQVPPAPAEPAVAVQGGAARVRVMVQSEPAVEYCELAIDGALIASKGKLFEGAVPVGGRVPRGKALPLRKPVVLFEGEVAPGRHLLQTGFVVSRVREEFGDLREGRRQRVVAEGVRALEAGVGEGAGTACTVAPGELCVVTARFRRLDAGLLTGRASYDVSYDTIVLSESDVQTANWASPEP